MELKLDWKNVFELNRISTLHNSKQSTLPSTTTQSLNSVLEKYNELLLGLPVECPSYKFGFVIFFPSRDSKRSLASKALACEYFLDWIESGIFF